MKCWKCQDNLLKTEKPEFPARDVETHLTDCQVCRDFQRRLVFIEGNVPRVPVPEPAPRAKERLLRAILQPAAVEKPVLRPAPAPLPVLAVPSTEPGPQLAGWWSDRRPNAAATAVIAVAAGVLLAVGLWLGNRLPNTAPRGGKEPVPQAELPAKETPPDKTPSTPKQQQDPKKVDKQPPLIVKGPTLMAKLMECDLRLAAPDMAMRERVEALAEMAEALQQETQILAGAAPPADLMKLAQLYKQVVNDGVVARARDLPMPQREVLKGLADQMATAGKDAEKLAVQVPASSAAFNEIRATALAGNKKLRDLMTEGTE